MKNIFLSLAFLVSFNASASKTPVPTNQIATYKQAMEPFMSNDLWNCEALSGTFYGPGDTIRKATSLTRQQGVPGEILRLARPIAAGGEGEVVG